MIYCEERRVFLVFFAFRRFFLSVIVEAFPVS
jgi:hypothetical protein